MNIQELAGEAKGYKAQFDSGLITDKEFKDLIDSLGIAQKISDNADQFAQNEEVRAYLMQLVQLAGLISSL
jgi:hypothetical protein